ncbi:MAG: ComEA family DNA-binding protein [Firmicutes bacterium]|nr:ComEA family DNA-binding protein [Bacillota bacterium]
MSIRERLSLIKVRTSEALAYNWKYNKEAFIKYSLILLFILILSIVFIFSGERNDITIISNDNTPNNSENVDSANESTEMIQGENDYIVEDVPELMYIDVAGAVVTPGVIQIEEGSRVFQAIALAGGLKPDADTMNVNLAAELHDGDKIFIPTVVEVKKDKKAGGIITNKVTTNVSTSENTLININTASSEQLQTLNGIGPSTAEKIIDYRNQYGTFKDVTDLLNVSGIGEKTLNKFKSKICV